MKGDFSRFTIKPSKHYQQVLLQQGRVLLDADFNEQAAMSAAGLRQLTRDLLGPHAGPAGDLGFVIGTQGGFSIGWGRYYVEGLLAANEPVPPADTAKPSNYQDQEVLRFRDAETIEGNAPYFFYLDVWERPVTWLEDDAGRETALGGPDTAWRSQVAWRVWAVKRPTGLVSKDDPENWMDENVRRHRGPSLRKGNRLPLMKAFVDPTDNPDETPFGAHPRGGYTGLENQLYRVEIHDADGPGPVTFKWSRDNGSVVAAWVNLAKNDLIVEGVGDTAHGFSAGQWVELTDKIGELRAEPGVMVRLTRVERDHLTYDPGTASGDLPTRTKMVDPIVRRWDHGGRKGQTAPLGGAIVVEEGTPYPLERGIKILFPAANPGISRRYVTGDHWVFAARAATADIEWPFLWKPGPQPTKDYLDREPDGVEHVYAPLSFLSFTPNGAEILTSFQRKIIQLWAAAK